MRGADVQQGGLFSYVSVEERVPQEHPLRGVRRLVRALTPQILYSIRSERLLCEQLDYNLL